MGKIKDKKNSVRAILIYEVIGRPKEYIEKVMKLFLDDLSKKSDVEMIKKKIFPIIELKNIKNVYSIIAETEFYFKDFETLLGFMIDSMPSSIEVIEPTTINLDLSKINAFINDYLTKIHQYDEVFKKLKLEKEILIKKIEELEKKLKEKN